MVALVEKLKEDILVGAEETLATLEEIEANVTRDIELLNEILSPPVITELHEMLVDHLKVNQRQMRLRRRVPVAKTRALLFVKAMIVGVKHCESMVQKSK
jgi:glycerophosphoryl diester phosphodiesterase